MVYLYILNISTTPSKLADVVWQLVYCQDPGLDPVLVLDLLFLAYIRDRISTGQYNLPNNLSINNLIEHTTPLLLTERKVFAYLTSILIPCLRLRFISSPIESPSQ